MTENKDNNEKDAKSTPPNKEHNISRRNVIKGIGAVSILGAFGYQFSKSLSLEKPLKKNVLSQLVSLELDLGAWFY